MNILALDCATKTGWATLVDGQIESGMQDFTKKRGESNGMLFLKFNQWLRRLNEYPFGLIVYEQAHHRGGAATEICVGLSTRAQEYAVTYHSEHWAVHTATLKKAITGNGRASKEDMMAYFKEQTGREPEDDNEADAYALLRYAMDELGEKS